MQNKIPLNALLFILFAIPEKKIIWLCKTQVFASPWDCHKKVRLGWEDKDNERRRKEEK